MRQLTVVIALLALFCAGLAFGADKKIISPPEVCQALGNIGTILRAARMSPADVVSVPVYLKDAGTLQRMNAVYFSYFKDPRPTRTTVVVAGLVGPGNIEITATARK